MARGGQLSSNFDISSGKLESIPQAPIYHVIIHITSALYAEKENYSLARFNGKWTQQFIILESYEIVHIWRFE